MNYTSPFYSPVWGIFSFQNQNFDCIMFGA